VWVGSVFPLADTFDWRPRLVSYATLREPASQRLFLGRIRALAPISSRSGRGVYAASLFRRLGAARFTRVIRTSKWPKGRAPGAVARYALFLRLSVFGVVGGSFYGLQWEPDVSDHRPPRTALSSIGFVLTRLDGTSKGGMVVAIQKELGLPIKFVGLGEQADDLQPFDAKQFAEALFSEKE